MCNNEDCVIEINNNDNIKFTNNKSLLGIHNNDKHNEVSNDNNIDYNPSSNNKGGHLVKYDYIDADSIKCMTEANIDNSTEANGHNEQKTIKIRTNKRNNEWWFCFNYDYIDLIIERNNINNNSNDVDYNPSQNNDGGSIGDIDVIDIPKLYNFLCYTLTGDTNSNHYWCFDNDDLISKRNNMINNNNVCPSPLYNNEGSLIEDNAIPKYTVPCHTSISDTVSNTQLIIVSSSLKGGARKVIKSNSNSNSISPICDHSDCPNKANVNNSNKSDSTLKDKTINLNNDGMSDDILTATTTTTTTPTVITTIIIMIMII